MYTPLMDLSHAETVFAFSAPIMFAFILVELIVSIIKERNYYDKKDSLGTIGMLAGNILVIALTKTSFLLLNIKVYEYRFFDTSESMPLWLLVFISFFAIDFVFYWYHRASHRVRFLWAVHMNHHSSQEMNFLVSFRQAWLGPIIKLPFFMVLPLTGFDPTVILFCSAIASLWGLIGHTKWINKLGILEYFMNTASHHRVHHGINPEYIDKNYGNMFIIWDKLLGTYAEEKAPVKYGLVTQVETINPFKLTIEPWQKLTKDMREADSKYDALAILFGPPDWQAKTDDKRAMQSP